MKCLLLTTLLASGGIVFTSGAATRPDSSILADDLRPALAGLRWPANEAKTPAAFDALALGAGPVSVAVRFTAPGADWTGTLLSRRARPGEPSLTVTAFRHEPFGRRFLGFAMDGIKPGPHEQGAFTVRDDVIGGKLIAAFCPLDATLDTGTHDLVLRCDGQNAELFIDGVRRESRSVEKFTTRTFLKLYPYHPLGWRLGSDPAGGDAFRGSIAAATLWPRALSDGEVRAASQGRFATPALTPPPLKGYASTLYPYEWSDEQRMAATDAALPRWLRDKLALDPWFPRFHPALPAGMMFDTRCAIQAGRYHLFPTWRPDMNLASGQPGAFRMQHLSSRDLVHWRLEPVPMRFPLQDVCNGGPVKLDGHYQFFFLRSHANGAPQRALPVNDELTAWTLPEPQPLIIREGAGYSGRLDSVVFAHGGHYYLTGTRRNADKPNMAMPLYRSDDLAKWDYIGDFYQTDAGKPFNECPQIFQVGGKMVVAAFYPLRGREDNYLVGRFENERFIVEAGGHWDDGGHGHVRSFDADTAPDGRVIGWSTISVYADHDALDVVRLGWKGMHSLPREVTLRPDHTLALQPAREIEQLRGAPVATRAGQKTVALPAGHDGQFELAASLAGGESITFATPDGQCTLSYDAQTRILTFDQTASPKIGSDHGHVFRTRPLPLEASGLVPVRVFFDHSVFEVYAGGRVLTSRYFARDPAGMTATRTGDRTPATAWKVGTIWADRSP